MMTEADDIVRLMELSSLLQHYRESVQRWEDAKKMNEAREHLFAARQRGLLSTDLQDAERDRQIAEYDSLEAEEKRQKIDPRKLYHSERSPDDDCRIAREAVQRCESALEKWVPSLNEFFEKAIKLGIEYKMPEIMKIRASRMMPHRINGFDWNQFSVELAEVEERAMLASRRGNSASTENDSIDDDLIDAYQVAELVGNERKSLNTNEWGDPHIIGTGRKRNKWLYSKIVATLAIQHSHLDFPATRPKPPFKRLLNRP